jgi:hypothetical protein
MNLVQIAVLKYGFRYRFYYAIISIVAALTRMQKARNENHASIFIYRIAGIKNSIL